VGARRQRSQATLEAVGGINEGDDASLFDPETLGSGTPANGAKTPGTTGSDTRWAIARLTAGAAPEMVA